jgi:hypothetical protein
MENFQISYTNSHKYGTLIKSIIIFLGQIFIILLVFQSWHVRMVSIILKKVTFSCSYFLCEAGQHYIISNTFERRDSFLCVSSDPLIRR